MEREVWECTLQGRKRYGAVGSRDVLMIVASECLEGPDIVPRKRGCLTQQDRDTLASQGIPEECWEDDVKLMVVRCQKMSGVNIYSIELCGQDTEFGLILDKMEELMGSTTKPGVIIHYIGPGKRDTGDWCFVDGFITFNDVLKLYMKHFHDTKKVLTIISNCSYSGHWVTACREFLDREGVQPCAHSARQKGVLLHVRASCKPNEIGYSLYHSIRVEQNDKNTGMWFYNINLTVEPDQHSTQVKSTQVTCGNTINETCKLLPGYTFQKEQESKRIHLVKGTDKGRPAWHYMLLADDEESMRVFKEKTQGELAGTQTFNMNDYGEVLKSGWGEDPPKDVEDWITRTYFGVMPQ